MREVIAATDLITTVAGTGTAGFSGDGGPATQAQLNAARSLALDGAGNLFIADFYNGRIREVVASSGVITTVAGMTGTFGYNGDGIPAVQAQLNAPRGVAVDPPGNLYIADSNNNRLRVVGDVISTTLSYDPAHPGDVIARSDPNGHTSTYAYDAFGNLVRTSDPLSNTTTAGYDLIGRLIDVVSPRGNVAGTNPISYTTTITYDAFGDTTAITDALGHAATYQYDTDRNLIAATDANGHATGYGYDLANERASVTQPDSGVFTTGYDGDGNIITRTDALGRTTTYAYDALNRLTGATDPLSRTILTGYDPAGNVITATDALGHATTYTYDALNHLVTVTDPLTRTTVYTYDAVDNRVALTDALTHTTSYGYDADHELTTITYALTNTPNVTFTYTSSGQRATRRDGTGLSTYQYDPLDRLVTATTGLRQSVGYGYDPAGNLTTLRYPTAGQTVTRTYDAANRLTGLTDWLGHTTAFTYDAADNLTAQTYPNTTTAGFSYNAANQLTGIVDRTGATPLWTFAYTRDALGQVTGATDPLDGQTHTYRYTPLNALAADQALTGTTAWRTNAALEITRVANAATPYTTTLGYTRVQELTRLRTLSGTVPLRDLTLSYNRDGDRVQQSDRVSGTLTSYAYDQANRLRTATVGGVVARYSYDGDGLRAGKAVSGTRATQVWDTAEGLPQLLQDGGVRYVMGPSGLPLEVVRGTGVQYVYQDQLGSTRALLTGRGQVAATFTYSPYGTLTGRTGTAGIPFGYAGQYTDAETGLQYLRARYYDSLTSQFVSVDPLVSLTGQPYTYAAANPLNGSDPSGACPLGPPSAAQFVQNPLTSYLCGAGHLLAHGCSAAQAALPSGPTTCGAATLVRQAVLASNQTLQASTAGQPATSSGPVTRLVQGAVQLARTSCSYPGLDADITPYVNAGAILFALLQPEEGLAGATDRLAVQGVEGGAESVDSLLMPAGEPLGVVGASATIREVQGGLPAAENMFAKLTVGGTDITPAGYPGCPIEVL